MQWDLSQSDDTQDEPKGFAALDKNKFQAIKDGFNYAQPSEETDGPKLNYDSSPYYTKITPGAKRPIRMGDSVTDIISKLYNLLRYQENSDKIQHEIEHNFEKEKEEKEEHRRLEILKIFKKKTIIGKPEIAKPKKVTEDTDKIDKAKGILETIFNKIKEFAKPALKTVAAGAGLGMAMPALSEIISGGESGGDYDAVAYSKSKLVEYGGEERQISTMTIAEVLDWQSTHSPSAAGKYQIIRSTLKDAVDKLDIDTNELYDEDMQEKIFTEALLPKSTREYLSGESDDVVGAQMSLAKVWAAIPVPHDIYRPPGTAGKNDPGRDVKEGESYYTGVGNNKSETKHTSKDYQQVLENAKKLNLAPKTNEQPTLSSSNPATLTPTDKLDKIGPASIARIDGKKQLQNAKSNKDLLVINNNNTNFITKTSVLKSQEKSKHPLENIGI